MLAYAKMGQWVNATTWYFKFIILLEDFAIITPSLSQYSTVQKIFGPEQETLHLLHVRKILKETPMQAKGIMFHPYLFYK